ncbi:hypothetical protein DJ72_13045 [Halorubrum distributum]|nr:hypothetical protein DJ72_13045 [Halorubrum distributum]
MPRRRRSADKKPGSAADSEPLAQERAARREQGVALGREMLRHPYWPLEAAHELGEEAEWPVQYRRGRYD